MKKPRWKGDSFYFRALVSLVIVAVISLTLVFSFFYPQILNSARNSMEDQRVNSMEQTVQAMDKIFDQINTIASIIERDPTLRPYSLHSGETLALYEASTKISQFTSAQSDLFDMFYYVDGMQSVIGSQGTADISYFNKIIWKLDGIDQAEIFELFRQMDKHQHILLPQDSCKLQPGDSGSKVLPYLISVSNSQKHYATLMVLFDANAIAAQLKRSWNDDTLFITDGTRILFSTDPGKTQSLDPGQLASSTNGGKLEGGSTLYISPSSRHKFSYGAVCSPDVLQNKLEALSSTALLFMLFASAGVLFLARFFTRWNYQPMYEFAADIGVDLSAKRSDSELLREHFHTLMNTNTQLAENLKQSQTMLEDAILQRLLISTPQERGQLIERGEKLGMIASPCLCTVAISPDSGKFTAPSRPQAGPLRIFEFHQAVGGGHTVILVIHTEESRVQEEVERALSSRAACMPVCYAPVCHSWHEIPETYTLLLKKLHSLGRIEDAGLVLCDDPRLEGEPESPFGIEALKELSDSLRDQSETGLRFALSHLCAFLSEQDRSVSELQSLTVEALYIICDALNLQGRLDSRVLDQMNPLAQGRLSDPKRMESLLQRAIELAMAGFPKPDQDSGRQLSKDVLLYIEEHLLDPNFSIYTISEAFGISESAFSHLFKRAFNQNFSAYVNQQKLVYAFDLLCNEDIPLEEVALRLGYSRASNFGRMFKAEVGISPGKYRSMYARKDDSAKSE